MGLFGIFFAFWCFLFFLVGNKFQTSTFELNVDFSETRYHARKTCVNCLHIFDTYVIY